MSLASLEERFQLLFEHAWDVILTLARDGVITSINHAFEKTSGWSRKEWLTRPLSELVHKNDHVVLNLTIERVLAGESPPPSRLRIVSRLGAHLVFEAAFVLVRSSPEGPEILCTARNVTERTRVEAALQSSETRFHELVESTRAVPFEADYTRQCFTYVGPQAVKLLGYPVKDWYAESFWKERVHPDDLGLAFFPARKAGSAPDEDLVYRMIRADAQLVWILHISRCDRHGRLCRGFLIDVTTRHQALESLTRSREQHRALAGRIQAAREEERLHVAREIHDELGQTLTGIRIDVMTARNELQAQLAWEASHPLLTKLAKAQQLVEESMRTVRRIATELRPPILDKVGLLAAVEWQAKDFQERFGIACLLDRACEEPVLDIERGTAIFRIFQEGLTNVARHAGATTINVLLKPDGDGVLLRIEDNGRGVTEADLQKSGAFGVLGMQERATAFGGELSMARRSAGGTRVIVRMPAVMP